MLEDNDNEWRVRQSAINTLGKLNNPNNNVINTLIKATTDNAWDVRRAALAALGNLNNPNNNVINALIKATTDNKWLVQETALTTLGNLNNPNNNGINALIKATSDKHWKVRATALKALAKLNNPNNNVINTLIQATTDNNWRVRVTALTALGNLNNPNNNGINILLKATTDNEWYARAAALTALGNLNNPNNNGINTLLKATSDKHWQVRQAALTALAKLNNPNNNGINALIKATRDSNNYARATALNALGNLNNPNNNVINTLIKATNDNTWLVREAALNALAKLNNPNSHVINALIKATTDKHWLVRATALNALGNLKNPNNNGINTLIKATSDNDWQVRRAALNALAKLNNPNNNSINTLLKATSDKYWRVRVAALTVLAKLNNPNNTVINTLLKATSDDEWRVREAAITALNTLALSPDHLLTFSKTTIQTLITHKTYLLQTPLSNIVQAHSQDAAQWLFDHNRWPTLIFLRILTQNLAVAITTRDPNTKTLLIYGQSDKPDKIPLNNKAANALLKGFRETAAAMHLPTQGINAALNNRHRASDELKALKLNGLTTPTTSTHTNGFSPFNAPERKISPLQHDRDKAKHLSPQQRPLTLLHCINNTQTNFALACIEHLDDVMLADDNGNTPIHWLALAGNHARILDALVNAGFDSNAKNKQGQTPLHVAATNGHQHTMAALMQKGARYTDLDTQEPILDKQGHSVAITAVRAGHRQCIDTLRRYGADLSVKDTEGRSLLHWAVTYPDLLSTLLQPPYSLPVNANDQAGATPAHYAADANAAKSLLLLHYRGAELGAQNKAGQSPMDLALLGNHNAAVFALLSCGATISSTQKEGLQDRSTQDPNAKILLNELNNHKNKQKAHRPLANATPTVRNVVLQGGGPTSLGHLGAFDTLFTRHSNEMNEIKQNNPQQQRLTHIHRIAATSTSAITAALTCVGYSIKDMTAIVGKKVLTDFLEGEYKAPFLKAKSAQHDWWWALKQLFFANSQAMMKKLQTDNGLFSLEPARQWIEALIKDQVKKEFLTFGELHDRHINHPKHYKDLYLIASNLSTGCTEVFSYETHPHLIISDAVCIALAMPFVFVPHQRYELRIDNNERKRSLVINSPHYVDGALYGNRPITLFDNNFYRHDLPKSHQDKTFGQHHNPQTLALRLVEYPTKEQKTQGEKNPKGILQFALGTIGAYRRKQAAKHVHGDDRNRTIDIDTRDINLWALDIKDSDQRSLIDAGKAGVLEYWKRVAQQTSSQKINRKTAVALINNSNDTYSVTAKRGGRRAFQLYGEVNERSPALIQHFYSQKNPNALTFFKQLNVPTHTRDEKGNTALHLAVSSGNIENVNRLLNELKLDPNTTNNAQQAPLDLALNLSDKRKRSSMVTALVRKGANQYHSNSQKSIIDICQQYLELTEDKTLEQAIKELTKPTKPAANNNTLTN